MLIIVGRACTSGAFDRLTDDHSYHGPSNGEQPAIEVRASLPQAIPRPDRTAALVRPGGLLLVTLAAGLAFAIDWESPIRAVLVFGFLLFVPGLAIAELAAIREPLQQLAIAPAASLAAETLIALALLYAGAYSPGRAFAVIVGLTVAATGIAALRAYRSGVSAFDSGRVRASA